MNRDTQRYMISGAKQAMDEYLALMHSKGKSFHLTIDPTASTFEVKSADDRAQSLRRSPISTKVREMILEDCSLMIPMTMKLGYEESNWYVGRPEPLTGGVAFSGPYFDKSIQVLDQQTERLYGLPLEVAYPDRQIGKTALSVDANTFSPI
jgi:hypothetical protein